MSEDRSDAIELDSYEPNYSNECECCGTCGTVMAVKDGRVIHDWGMCGVCTFGTAKALDPAWWNSDDN